jgi:hypothetical protein
MLYFSQSTNSFLYKGDLIFDGFHVLPTAGSYPLQTHLQPRFSIVQASSDATALSRAAQFDLSSVNTPGLMHDRRFQGHPAAGQSLSSGCTADPSEEAETSDSDDDDDENAGDENAIEVSQLRITQTAEYNVTLILPL